MSLEAGRLRHEVRIERLDYMRDSNGDAIQDPDSGEVSTEWVEVATIRAAIEPLSAREFNQSAATQSQVTARIVIRHRDDIDAACRIVHLRTGRADVIYNIHGILPDLDSGLEYITMPVSSGVSEGQ